MKSLSKSTLFLLALCLQSVLTVQASDTLEISVSGRQVYCPMEDIFIGSNFSISDPNSNSVDAFYIQISSGYQVNIDQLRLTGDHPNIQTSWDVIEGKLTISYVGSVPIPFDVLENVVRDVVYTSLNVQISNEKFFSFSIGEASFLPSNGHYYEYVPFEGITWGAAKAEAESRTYFGLQGYLATVTSEDEAQLTGEQARGTGWIAGSDQGTEGVWIWLSGPETGTVFWNGGPEGSSPNFAFWNQGEPNNLGSEHYAHITDPSIGVPGSWNDLPFEGGSGLYAPKGYIVEYGGMPGDPEINISASTSIYVPQIETTFNAEICVSGVGELRAFPSEGEVQWFDQMNGGNLLSTGTVFTTPFLTESTTYYAMVVVNGCQTVPRTPVEANVNQFPQILSINDDVVCVGSSANLSATSDFGTIQWYETLTSSTPLSSGSFFITPELFQDTTYYVEADQNGCGSGDRFPVQGTVDSVYPSFELPEEATICLNEGSVFVEAMNPGGTYFYQWRNEEGDMIGSAQGIPISSGGVYTVIAISSSGCVSDPKRVTIYESELASFSSENLTIEDETDNNRIIIDSNSLGSGTYEFALDDPNGPFTSNTTIDQISPGLHTLYIRDVGGCGSLSYQFSVLDYPSFFTPNDDGVNDYWQLKGINRSFYTIAEIKIYNRYGVLVANVDPESRGWNGVSKGWRLPSNDYWFSAKLTDVNGITVERKGHFSLLRR